LIQEIKLIKTLYNIFFHHPVDADRIQRQGLLSMKVAQTFALRPDVLPFERCQELSKLFSNTKSLDKKTFKDLLTKSVNSGWHSSFQHISGLPLASASIGQVHEATLKTGEQVVIKLVRDDWEKSFRRDILAAERILKSILLVRPKLQQVADPLGALKAIELNTLSELDLNNEIEGQANLISASKILSQQVNLDHVAFPHIYKDLSNARVMVSEKIEGMTVEQLIIAGKLEYEDMLRVFQAVGSFIFGAGVFHGDPHSGNIMLSKNKIWFLDTGVIGRVDKIVSGGLLKFFDSISQYDYENAVNSLASMSSITIDTVELQKRLERIYYGFEIATAEEASFTQKMMETIKAAVNAGMSFPKGMYPIIKSMMYLDGMVLRSHPSANLMEDIKPFIKEFVKLDGKSNSR
tara:strand:+ start:18332 stop:19549 length:1218 start_codon:yes stop_codon:yes gene_type:complete